MKDCLLQTPATMWFHVYDGTMNLDHTTKKFVIVKIQKKNLREENMTKVGDVLRRKNKAIQ